MGRSPAKKRELGEGGSWGHQRKDLTGPTAIRRANWGGAGTHREKADMGHVPLLPYLSGKVHTPEFG